MNPINEIVRFAKDRGIDRLQPDNDEYVANVIEELLELGGYSVPKEKRPQLRDLANNLLGNIVQVMHLPRLGSVDKESRIDAIGDVAVFSLPELTKYNVDPSCILNEIAKEINSRTGKIVDGKFQKDENVKTYKAQFGRCENE
jgi:hypothetical protein